MTDIITGDRLLLAILNMSFNGTLIIGIVLVLRWLMLKTMKDLPRSYIVWLWAIPFFRLLCPADLSRWLGKLSLIPWNSQPLSVVNHRAVAGAPYQGIHPQIDTGFVPVDQWLNNAVVQSLPAPTEMASIDPFQITQFVLFLIWAFGAIALLLVTIWNWWKLRQTISDAVLYRRDGNVKIYETDRISTAFVVGWIRYKIYLPTGLSEEEVNCVLHHEFAHIKRNDPLWKLLAYVSVNLHWFNPSVWFAYKTLIRDIEMACDERAIQNTDPKLYTSALLKLSMRGSGLLAPLAFGEGSIKERIVNALKVKEPRRVVCILAAAIIAVAGVACASNQEDALDVIGGGNDRTSILVGKHNDVFWETAGFTDEEIQLAMFLGNHRTSDEKDQALILDLIYGLDWGSDIELHKVNFQTNAEPYEIQLWFQWKEGMEPTDVVIDQAKIAMNEWLILSQVEKIDAIAVTVTSFVSEGMEEDMTAYPTYQVVYDRTAIEAANAEALTHIVSIATDRSLHPDGVRFRGEPTLWDLGEDTETLILLIRSLNVARGVQEDVLFGSAKDPGVAMLLPSLPALPVTDTDGSMNELATAATQQMITYIENLPYDISQHELREQGFVTNVRGLISDNRDRWEFFLSQYGKGFEPKSEVVAAGPLIPNGGGLGEDVLLMGTITREGDWILYGILAYEDGFVMIRDISRDEFRDTKSAEYSVRMFKHLVYKESREEEDHADHLVILTDEDPDSFVYEELPEIHWELFHGIGSVS